MILELLASHFVCDFPLQTDWIAKHKNRHNPSPETAIWPWVLTAHAVTHGLGVGIVTGRLGPAVAETVVHWVIDFGKCENWYGFHADQALHLGCKLLWWSVL